MTGKLPSWLFLFLSLLLLGATDAHADTSSITFSSVAQFAGGNWGAYSVVNVDAYSSGGAGGGGVFVQQSCTANLGTCFADSSLHTFQRVNPRWDAAEWGIVGDHVTDNSARLNAMMTAAVTAGQLTATIAQNGQYYASTGITIPGNFVLQCLTSASAQAEDATGAQTGGHKNYPYTILIPSTATVTGGTSKGVGAKLKGCKVLNKAVYDTDNPTTYQSILTTLAAFSGTGFTCGGDGCAIEDSMILGFTTGWTATGKDTTQVHNVTVDATNCFSLTNSQFIVGDWDNFICSGILTTRLSFGLLHLPIDAIAASPSTPANYRLHLATPCVDATGNCAREGNTIWIAQPSGSIPVGVESVAGRCTVHYIDTSNFECTNSQATATTATGTTVLGSTRVCGFTPANIQYVRQLQVVSGAGITGGTTVAAVDSRMGCVWLSVAATAAASVSITFTDNAYSGGTLYQASLWTNNRLGTGFALNNVNNGKFLHCKIDGHFPAYQWNTGSAHNTFEGCGGEGENNNLDAAAICLDIEGGSANSWLGGSCHYGTNQGTTVLNNNVTGSNVATNLIKMNDTGSTGIGNVFLANEAGPIDFESSSGGAASAGDIFVADATQTGSIINNLLSQGANVRYQSATAETKVRGSNNTLASGSVPFIGTVTGVVTAFAGGGQAGATRMGTDYNRVANVATAGDSVMLRHAIAGRHQVVTNSSARAMQVYGYFDTSDTINGIATGTGISQPPGTTWDYVTAVTGDSRVNNLFGVTPQMFVQGNTALTVPADTTEDTLATIILPANALGANGCIVLRTTWSETASTNAKTQRAYLGGTGGMKFLENAVTGGTAAGSTRFNSVCNRNATNSQIGSILEGITGNSTTGVPPTGSQDTTTALNIVITGQKASSGESLVLQQYSILLEPHT